MPKNKLLRLVVDTNLWISFLLTKDYTKLDKILFSGKVTLIFSQELLSEFVDVVNRPKFRKYFSQSDIEDILETIDEYAEFVEVNTEINACRDSKDNFLLALAVDGKADYLLTGDKDLLEIKKISNAKIITITDYFAKA